MTKRQRHQNALSKAVSWQHPVMIRRYILEAHKIKPLTDMQWYHLAVAHSAWVIDPIRKIAEGVSR